MTGPAMTPMMLLIAALHELDVDYLSMWSHGGLSVRLMTEDAFDRLVRDLGAPAPRAVSPTTNTQLTTSWRETTVRVAGVHVDLMSPAREASAQPVEPAPAVA